MPSRFSCFSLNAFGSPMFTQVSQIGIITLLVTMIAAMPSVALIDISRMMSIGIR